MSQLRRIYHCQPNVTRCDIIETEIPYPFVIGFLPSLPYELHDSNYCCQDHSCNEDNENAADMP